MKLYTKELISEEIKRITQRWDKSDKSFVMSERLQYELFGMRYVIAAVWSQEHTLYKQACAAIKHIINTNRL